MSECREFLKENLTYEELYLLELVVMSRRIDLEKRISMLVTGDDFLLGLRDDAVKEMDTVRKLQDKLFSF